MNFQYYFNFFLQYLYLGIGLIGIGGAAAVTLFVRYDEIEAGAKGRLASYAAELYDLLDRMFKRKTMNECYLLILIPTLSFGAIGFLVGLALGIVVGPVFMILFGYMGFKLPRIVVRAIFQRRVEKFDRQLVDALNMMANAVKSGLSFLQVIQVLEREMPKPCSEEFGMVLKENRVGVNLNDALLNMVKRMPSDDLFMIINSVVTLSQQGGDLSEAFETIAETIRERQRVADKIRTMAQAGMTQAIILSSLPFVMLAMEWFIQPQYTILLFNTPLGIVFVCLMVLMIAGGAFWMKKILTIDI